MNEVQTLTAALNTLAAILEWIASRGIAKQDAVALLDLAKSEGRNVTTDEVRQLLNKTTTELDQTQTLIDEL